MKAHYKRYFLKFKRPVRTSQRVLTEKETWFLFLTDGKKKGVGECGLFRGLSIDDREDYEDQLKNLCRRINENEEIKQKELQSFPSIKMGYEMALMSIKSENTFELFPSAFTRGEESIRTNGLVWMGNPSFMKDQIDQKIAQGFNCIKLKIGALDFNEEMSILCEIRKHFDEREMILRVDANGSFSTNEAMNKLKSLADLGIHSIEQPIAKGQYDEMKDLCLRSPIPIALDEELIGVTEKIERVELLDKIMPQYLIFKPSLLGGFRSCEEWIALASERSIGWWVTSALESNIGLNAIAQWTFSLRVNSHQGLGTGKLFTNNFESPLEVRNGTLTFNSNQNWNFPFS
ncbi:MAG: o-succinylbenzoate synthase [Flavobacteriaceae bacterium TMED212]|nr:MAG: o-succinylbenzoate synthase [Flavobacteriaceae bacterium TMED212]|tara:strand:- start:8959 stop:9996 length:1038 start_codon:yes stop_codon:yes gene_type:complete